MKKKLINLFKISKKTQTMEKNEQNYSRDGNGNEVNKEKHKL